MRNLIILFIGLAIVGCDGSRTKPLGRFDCTVEQHSRVESETLFCKEETGYIAGHCYISALQRICPLKENTR